MTIFAKFINIVPLYNAFLIKQYYNHEIILKHFFHQGPRMFSFYYIYLYCKLRIHVRMSKPIC